VTKKSGALRFICDARRTHAPPSSHHPASSFPLVKRFPASTYPRVR
jgi:hypothetical protein